MKPSRKGVCAESAVEAKPRDTLCTAASTESRRNQSTQVSKTTAASDQYGHMRTGSIHGPHCIHAKAQESSGDVGYNLNPHRIHAMAQESDEDYIALT